MAGITITNWFGDLVSHPQVVVEATSVDDIVKILKDPDHYPSPVRAVGSNHSTAPVGVAEGGTLIKMSKMNRILEIGQDTVTVQAGAIAIDVAQELEKHGLQFYVNTEIGSLSVGSAACAGTKDASMPGEYRAGRLVHHAHQDGAALGRTAGSDRRPAGADAEGALELRHSSASSMRPLTAYAPSFRWRCTTRLIKLDDFLDKLPDLKTTGESMMYYMFPFEDLITVEFRRYNPDAKGDPDQHVWPLRNYMWATAGPLFCAQVEANIPIKTVRYKVIDGFCALWRFKLENLVQQRQHRGHRPDHPAIRRWPTTAATRSACGRSRRRLTRRCCRSTSNSAKKYYEDQGYRNNMLYVGYRILKDRQSLLSYSWDGNVMTIDPVSTANPGWTTFLPAYNQFCSDHGRHPAAQSDAAADARAGRERRWATGGSSSPRRAAPSTRTTGC